MTASYRHLPLAEVQPGMVLSDELLDQQGQVLLPAGAVLTETMLERMPAHGIESLAVVDERPADPAQLAAEREAQLARIAATIRTMAKTGPPTPCAPWSPTSASARRLHECAAHL